MSYERSARLNRIDFGAWRDSAIDIDRMFVASGTQVVERHSCRFTRAQLPCACEARRDSDSACRNRKNAAANLDRQSRAGHMACCCDRERTHVRRRPRTVRSARCNAECILSSENGAVVVHANAKFPVNRGGLCVKGWTAAATLAHADRLREPLVRGTNGRSGRRAGTRRSSASPSAFNRIQTPIRPRRGGRARRRLADQRKGVSLGKFARVALGTANIDYNGRFCMSSAAAAATRAFGIDRGLPFPLEDIARSGGRSCWSAAIPPRRCRR